METSVRPFSLPPVWKLQPCYTEHSTTSLRSAFRDYESVEQFVDKEFDMSSIRKKGFVVSGLRSDGFQVHLSFIALASKTAVSTNVEELKDVGYVFPKPSSKVDCGDEKSGVYTVGETRIDVEKIPTTERENRRVTVIDPGCDDVVSARTTPLPNFSIQNILQQSLAVLGIHRAHGLFRGLIQRGRESKRRSRVAYRGALRDVEMGRKKSANLASKVDNVRWITRHFEAINRETNSNGRRKTRFIMRRILQIAMDRLANRIVKAGRCECPGTKSVVFFGNGSSRPMRGSAALP